jgi:hypothetical protein
LSFFIIAGEGINSKFDKKTGKGLQNIKSRKLASTNIFAMLYVFLAKIRCRHFKIFKMETVLVQINNYKAYKLLEDLEDLHIIKVLKKSIEPQQKLSEKYAGKLPSDIADELQNYVTQSRSEWNNRSI